MKNILEKKIHGMHPSDRIPMMSVECQEKMNCGVYTVLVNVIYILMLK